MFAGTEHHDATKKAASDALTHGPTLHACSVQPAPTNDSVSSPGLSTTEAQQIAKTLTAAQVNVLQRIRAFSAADKEWHGGNDPRMLWVSGLGKSLSTLIDKQLVEWFAAGYIITARGELVAQHVPALDDLIAADDRYKQIMENAASTADMDTYHEYWVFMADVKASGTGHGILAQMIAYGLLETDNAPVQGRRIMRQYRLSDDGRRFLREVLHITPADEQMPEPEAGQGAFDIIAPRPYSGPKAHGCIGHQIYRASSRPNRLNEDDLIQLSMWGWL